MDKKVNMLTEVVTQIKQPLAPMCLNSLAYTVREPKQKISTICLSHSSIILLHLLVMIIHNTSER